MKTFIRFSSRLMGGLSVACLLVNCTPEAADDIFPATGCRLTQYSQTYGQPNSSQSYVNEQATYTYDAEGRLSKADTVKTGSEVSGDGFFRVNTDQRYTTEYRYNAEGYLTRLNSRWDQQFAPSAGPVEKRQQTYSADFTYSGGKLTGYTSEKVGAFGLTTYVQGVFEYDGTGNLVKRTQTITYDYDPEVVQEKPVYQEIRNTWIYADNQLVDVIYQFDGTEYRNSLIQNGLLTRTGGTDSYTEFEYDSQKRLTRQAYYRDGQLNNYFTQEWSEGLPAAAAFPAFKGFPATDSPLGKVEPGVLRKFRYYYDYPDEGLVLAGETTHTYQFNTLGLVTNLSSESRNMEADGKTYTTTPSPAPVVYTYDCQ
jgi:hypothetical protein